MPTTCPICGGDGCQNCNWNGNYDSYLDYQESTTTENLISAMLEGITI